MAILPIRKYPDEVLKKKAAPVADINGSLQKLIKNMLETMYAAPGIGLAAPQVGESRRLIVLDLSTTDEKHPLIVLINPEITEAEGMVESEEGCLSVPGYSSVIKRAGNICVRGLDREGKPVEIEGTGLLARALQHEIDHLDGILYIDRMSAIKREFFKKRYQKTLSELRR